MSKAHQEAAYAAVRKGVLDYDKRHGYRGAEGYFELPQNVSEDALEDALQEQSDSDDIYPGAGAGRQRQGGQGLSQGRRDDRDQRRRPEVRAPDDRRQGAQQPQLRRGALIRVQQDEKGSWQIVQLPQVEAALVSLDPNDGAIRALVGGFDFNRNKFNHATQA